MAERPETPKAGPRSLGTVSLLIATATLLVSAVAFAMARPLLVRSGMLADRAQGVEVGGLVALGLGLIVLALLALMRRVEAMEAATRELATRHAAGVEAIWRIASALEQAPAPATSTASPTTTPRGPLDEVRAAIAAGDWEEASRLVEAIASERPGSTEARAAAEVLERGRESARRDLRARLDASQSANDPASVLGYRGQLAVLIDEEALRQLDQDLLRWLMGLLMRRMRTGTVRADVASLAEMIAEQFPASPEGASLRASLPTLRRSAGLCPRCAKPYTGIDEACPECLAPSEPPASGPTLLPIHDEAEGEDEDDGGNGLASDDELSYREPE